MAKTKTVVTTFDNISIKRIAFNFKNAGNAIATNCNGQLDGETEMQTVVKKCGATEVKSKSKPINMTVTITAHVPMEVYRRFNGLKQDGRIKPGIYSYGPDSVGEDFSLAAEIVDDFEENRKLVGMLACTSNTGLTFSIENGADEVAALELEAKVMQDEFGKFYHEAIVAELEEDLTDQWMTNLSADVIKKTSVVPTTATQSQ
ncbi:phage tail protein [Enterococcus faecium]|uniref:phage tail protein n=1 Tax=Enterococcus faecium TaxID=1352 RepID=UPI0039C6ADCE